MAAKEEIVSGRKSMQVHPRQPYLRRNAWNKIAFIYLPPCVYPSTSRRSFEVSSKDHVASLTAGDFGESSASLAPPVVFSSPAPGEIL